MFDQWFSSLETVWLGIVAVMGLGVTLQQMFTRFINPVFRGLRDFLEAWHGTPCRPGRPAQLGVMEKLARIEQMSTDAAFNSKSNHGTSAYDKMLTEIRQINTEVLQLTKTVTTLSTDIEKLQDETREIKVDSTLFETRFDRELEDLKADRSTLRRLIDDLRCSIKGKPDLPGRKAS